MDQIISAKAEFITPKKLPNRSYEEWSEIFIRRQEEQAYDSSIPEYVKIKIPSSSPILLVPFGDIHGGAPFCNYQRLIEEVSLVLQTPNTFAFTLGDLTDSYFWGGEAQDTQIANFAEQNNFLRSILVELGKKKKLLAGWAGDHDNWASKTGETLYANFTDMTGAYYLEGVSYISLYLNEIEYKISGAHRHPGISIYSKAAASLRMERENARGTDIAITAHNHEKGYSMQPIKFFDGTTSMIHCLSIGAYKSTDGYSRKLGFARAGKDNMGPQAILLNPKEKNVNVYWTVREGVDKLTKGV